MDTVAMDAVTRANELKTFFQSFYDLGFDPVHKRRLYDIWAKTYDEDSSLMVYKAPEESAVFLSQHFEGDRETALVYDVVCGSGLVAKEMAKLGFKHFVGTDGSEEMLKLAEKTGLYQETHLALLGPEPLPKQTGSFDAVTLVGGLKTGSAPYTVVRELCAATKPGGLIVMSRCDHRGAAESEYSLNLETEMRSMEEEGLWTKVGVRHTDKYYLVYPNMEEEETGSSVAGSFLLYKKN